jgi:CheY-like chemotaxis protein
VLVAEDNTVNVVVVRTILERAGYEVKTASDGREAIVLLEREPFDLVLMDISMPGMDGVEATRRIREGELAGAAPDIPVVAITAHSMQGDREQFLEAGMTDYLAKPFSKETMLEMVARLLRGRIRAS